MATGKKPPSSSSADKKPTPKLKAGKRTVRTSGISQSAFAGYATPPAPTTPKAQTKPAAKPSADSESDSDPKPD